MKRKCLAYMLAVCMMIGMLPVAAMAAEDTTSETVEAAVDSSNGLTPPEGEDGAASLVPADGNTVNGAPSDTVAEDTNPTDIPEAVAKLTVGETITYYPEAQDALDAVGEAGGTVTLLQDVPGSLSVNGKTDLIVDGNGCTVGAVNFYGTNNGVSLQNVNFELTAPVAIDINSNAEGIGNRNITISHCTFTLNEESAPWIAICVQKLTTGLVIEENTFTINRQAGNEFQCIGFAYTPDMRTTDAIVRDNTMTANHTEGYSYFVIGGQDAYNNNDPADQTYGIKNLEISGNKIAYPNDTTGEQYPIFLANTENLQVTGNTFEDCWVGVFLNSTTGGATGLPTKNVTVTGNTGDTTYVALINGSEALTGTFETDAPFYMPIDQSKRLTVTFDPNGGSCDVGTKVWILTDGATSVTLGELPTPTRSGSYEFKGWSTEDGSPVTAETTVSADTTLYAQWDYTGSYTPTYSSTVESSDNGSVRLSSKNTTQGSTVTVTVTPDEGYVLDTLTVTGKDGKTVEVTQTGDNKYTYKMPGFAVTVKATFKEETSVSAKLPFTDVEESAWYYDAVCYAYENGMMAGTNDGTTFSPAMDLTRGMMTQILYNVEGKPDLSGENLGYPFADVPGDTWYADGVYWARENGIADGYGDNAFGPENSVTREQMAVLLYNYAGFKGDDVTASADLSTFTDGGQVSEWAEKAMQWAVAEGVIQGSDNALNPQGTASRAEVAQILMNYFGQTAAE